MVNSGDETTSLRPRFLFLFSGIGPFIYEGDGRRHHMGAGKTVDNHRHEDGKWQISTLPLQKVPLSTTARSTAAGIHQISVATLVSLAGRGSFNGQDRSTSCPAQKPITLSTGSGQGHWASHEQQRRVSTTPAGS
jgi:hypothetical protein